MYGTARREVVRMTPMELKTTKKGTYLKIDPADDDFGMMLNWSVRYSIGRMTYAPSSTMEFIFPLIP